MQALQAQVATLQTQIIHAKKAAAAAQAAWDGHASFPWPHGQASLSSSSSSCWYTCRPLTAEEIVTLQSTGCQTTTANSNSSSSSATTNNNNNSLASWHENVRLAVPVVAATTTTTKFCTNLSALLRQRVSRTTFGPRVVLVVSDNQLTPEQQQQQEPASAQQEQQQQQQQETSPVVVMGCHDNGCIGDTVLDLRATCVHNTRVQRTVLQAKAALVSCGNVFVVPCCPRRNGNNNKNKWTTLTVEVGPESGGRRALHLPPDATMPTVTQQMVGNRKNMNSTSSNNNNNNNNHKLPLDTNQDERDDDDDWNVLLAGSWIRHTPTVCHVMLHKGAYIEGATAVTQSWLFPDAYIAHGASVSHCLLQWKAHVVHHSTVEHVFLMECAAAGPHSFCSHAVLGPDVHISAGEVHASILGPNTNAHHQSLCIGVLWPVGRGNVGYGANVGSNHTGRLPDQEVAAPEGCFWGLSVVVVMPVNLERSPYSIVAAGSTLTSTRVAMPFSLLQTGSIVPAWVYGKSPYTIVRSAHKYATRRKAKRHAFYTGWDILRPTVVQMCVVARHGLRQNDAAAANSGKVPTGCGNLKCNQRGRSLGIKTYTQLIQRFALQELLRLCLQYQEQHDAPQQMVQKVARALNQAAATTDPTEFLPSSSTVEWAPFPWEEDASQDALYRRALMVQEYPLHNVPPHGYIRQGLELLRQLETDFAKAIYTSKARDDARGADTIPQYADAHVAAADDPVIIRTNQELKRIVSQIDKVLMHLPTSSL